MGNAVVVSDPAGNLKFDKGKSHSTSKLRIDGAVALAMAVAPGPPPEPPRDFRMIVHLMALAHELLPEVWLPS